MTLLLWATGPRIRFRPLAGPLPRQNRPRRHLRRWRRRSARIRSVVSSSHPSASTRSTTRQAAGSAPGSNATSPRSPSQREVRDAAPRSLPVLQMHATPRVPDRRCAGRRDELLLGGPEKNGLLESEMRQEIHGGEKVTYVFRWNRPGLPGRKGTRCKVLARGKMNSCMVEFEDGFRAIVSRNALRKAVEK